MLRKLHTLIGNQYRSVVTANKIAVTSSPRFELSSALFDEIRSRVKQDGRTVEKILVTLHQKNGTEKNYLMNRNVSTAYDCAKHLNMNVAKTAVLSLVSYPDEETRLESMNEPLRDKCDFELIDFQTEKYTQAVNQAYWRSCSIVLAAALLRGIKENITISNIQCEFPKCYFAVDLNGLRVPLSENDLKDLSSIACSDIVCKRIPFETVTLPSEVAVDYGFSSSVKLCRLGDFVSEVDGPVISRSDQIGRFEIVKAISKENFTRVGGVSLPSAFKASSFSWETIVMNAQDKLT